MLAFAACGILGLHAMRRRRRAARAMQDTEYLLQMPELQGEDEGVRDYTSL